MKFILNLIIVTFLFSFSSSSFAYGDSLIVGDLQDLLQDCRGLDSLRREVVCYRRGIRRIIRENEYNDDDDYENDLQCVGVSLYGKWANGGGCNVYGCWYPRGGCNVYGCWYEGGKCNVYGCIQQSQKTQKACVE